MSSVPRTAPEFLTLKGVRKTCWITAYTAWQARLAESAGMDGILVGDSVGMTELGHTSTIPVTMDDMVRHTAAVRHGTSKIFVVADLPFLSYSNPDKALANAGRLIQEAAAHAVKLEGGAKVVPIVKRLVDEGIPVMGHIGLTPQMVHVMGGFRVQGRNALQALSFIDDARALAEAGVFSLVLEGMPDRLAEEITRRVSVPTVGIGAGPAVDGQILVFHDVVGISDRLPKLAKAFGQAAETMSQALVAYRESTELGHFPDPDHTYHMSDHEQATLSRILESDLSANRPNS